MESKKETIASVIIVLITIFIISWGLFTAKSSNDQNDYDLSVFAKNADLHSLEVRIQGTEDGINSVRTEVSNIVDNPIQKTYEPSADCIAVDSEIGDGKKVWECTDYSQG